MWQLPGCAPDNVPALTDLERSLVDVREQVAMAGLRQVRQMEAVVGMDQHGHNSAAAREYLVALTRALNELQQEVALLEAEIARMRHRKPPNA